MTRLLAIDGHSVAYRAYYALRVENFINRYGQPNNVIYGFLSTLIKLIQQHEPTHIGVAFDVSRVTFRNESYPDYKATREETPADFLSQMEPLKQFLTALNVHYFEVPNYEADDILATLVKQAEAQGFQTLVVSGDRDTFQLINPHTKILFPQAMSADFKLMDDPAVFEKYGVHSNQYSDLAALVGENSDNIHGVDGVGPKYAAKWIQTYGTLEAVIEHADEIGGKKGQALKEAAEQVRLNRQINRLVDNLELDVPLKELIFTTHPQPHLDNLFDQLGFGQTLRKRVYSVFSQPSQSGDEEFTAVPVSAEATDDSLQKADDSLQRAEGSLYFQGVSASGLATKGNSDLPSDFSHLLSDKPVTNHQSPITLSAATYIYDYKAQLHSGKLTVGTPNLFDVKLAGYIINSELRDYSLDSLFSWFNCSDLETLGQFLQSEIQERNAQELLAMEMQVSEGLFAMESAGVKLDLSYLEKLAMGFEVEARGYRETAESIAGYKINLASPKQLQQLLFTELKLPTTRKIKTGYSTDASSLQDLYAKTQHPFLDNLLKYRNIIKLHQICLTLQENLHDDLKVHSSFDQTGTATGRLNSTNPNLQNIPIRSTQGAKIRKAFIPSDGYDALISADYSQIELRIMASMSNDSALIEAFQTGEDLHQFIASQVFKVPLSEVTPSMRSSAKAVSYGLAYGETSYGLASSLKIPNDAAVELMNTYFSRFNRVKVFLDEVVEQAVETGYTETLLGRRRYIPNLQSPYPNLVLAAKRMALNAPIQGTAADIIKLAMIEVHRALTAHNLQTRILAQIHDELLLETLNSELDQVKQILTDTMSSVLTLKVPLEVAIGVGDSWQSAEH
ncbi:MAG: DNA polymerase I [Bifidobacteriaceae bacterium]|jgi:DNA polymerase-1|nr:DNA polymerase I [Bifidobacteriaceae bacterium]